jgi:hypothetical protein
MRFSNRLVAERVQPFWEALQAGEVMTDAAALAGTHRWRGVTWLREAGGVRPRRGRDLQGRCLSFAEREEIALAGGESMRMIAARTTAVALTARIRPSVCGTRSAAPVRPLGEHRCRFPDRGAAAPASRPRATPAARSSGLARREATSASTGAPLARTGPLRADRASGRSSWRLSSRCRHPAGANLRPLSLPGGVGRQASSLLAQLARMDARIMLRACWTLSPDLRLGERRVSWSGSSLSPYATGG